MSTIVKLLDAAKEKTGSDYKTAKLLGVTPQVVSDWRNGRDKGRPQPEDHALVAAVAGLDAEEALIRALLAKYADKPKGEKLLSALGNVLARTGAAVTLLFLASGGLGTTPTSAEARTTSRSDNVHNAQTKLTTGVLSTTRT